MICGSLRMSANAAIGIPQFATGPQKCVLNDGKRDTICKPNQHEFYSMFLYNLIAVQSNYVCAYLIK